MTMLERRVFCAALAAAALPTSRGWAAVSSSDVRVAAASDLKFALAELAARYERETGQRLQLNLGSSGNFAQQIRQGLPVDLFMSADEAFALQLADAGLTQDRGVLYALGRIAAVVPAASPIELDAQLRGLAASWGSVTSFAMANPEHAPYGRAAQQALQRLGLWGLAKTKLVLGENIAQTTQFVTSGAAQAGITALSLAVAPEVAHSLRRVVLPAALHDPLRQRMVLLKGASAEAAGFYRYVQGPDAKAVLSRHGFVFE
jgi:molybdate transport system substrate-binding protein